MSEESWQKWVQSLQQNHLRGVALTFLEEAGPLKMILSQVMHATSPFLGGNSRTEWQAIAEMLEDEKESQKFALSLREETTQ